jgi:cytochrome c
MKTALMGLAALLLAGSAQAEGELELAKAKQCMSCHSEAKDALAPSFKSIAAKYRQHPEAEQALVVTVRKGSPDVGSYHWGMMKMPMPGPRPAVTQAEAEQLVRWVLSQH